MDKIPCGLWLAIATVAIWTAIGIGLVCQADPAITGAGFAATFAVWFFGKGYSVEKFFGG